MLIIDKSAFRVMNFDYCIDKAQISDLKQATAEDHFLKIEKNMLNSFGLLAGPQFN